MFLIDVILGYVNWLNSIPPLLLVAYWLSPTQAISFTFRDSPQFLAGNFSPAPTSNMNWVCVSINKSRLRYKKWLIRTDFRLCSNVDTVLSDFIFAVSIAKSLWGEEEKSKHSLRHVYTLLCCDLSQWIPWSLQPRASNWKQQSFLSDGVEIDGNPQSLVFR